MFRQGGSLSIYDSSALGTIPLSHSPPANQLYQPEKGIHVLFYTSSLFYGGNLLWPIFQSKFLDAGEC